MCRTLLLPLAFALGASAQAQLYYPPVAGNAWEAVDPAALGWCTDAIPPLLGYLDETHTKAFIVLKDGRIAIEHYFGTFTADSLWYWASAAKSLTAFLVGQAQAEGLLGIDSATSAYLGPGWTSCATEQEQAITLRHQLSMTTGLDDGAGNADCTDPACLECLAGPGTRWAYHNAPYTLLDEVLEAATGQTVNAWLFNRLTLATGLQGAFVPLGYNNVFFSKARALARFGLLCLGQGAWGGAPVLGDPAYFSAMVSPSQALNPAYGYLWWLNGQDGYMLPGLPIVLPGMLCPAMPPDAYSAMGKDGQLCNVSPATGLVVVRMGNAPTPGLFVPNAYNNEIWVRLNAVLCNGTAVPDRRAGRGPFLHPNPAAGRLTVELPDGTLSGELRITDAAGRTVLAQALRGGPAHVDVQALAPGAYQCTAATPAGILSAGFVKE